jgi:hypothetical protein
MKTVKILMAGCVLATLVACDKVAALKDLVSTNDSAETEMVQENDQLQQQEVEQMAELINAVSAGLDSIQDQEQLITRMDEATPKGVILSQLQAIRDVLNRKTAEIERLTSEAKSDKATIVNLKKTLEFLNKELEAKSERIAKLEEAVRTRDAKISELVAEVDMLTIEGENLRQKTLEQDRQLNTAYYIVGSKKELKKLGLLEGGGLFSKKRANYSNINNSVFQKVNIRSFTTLTINSKSPKLMTEKPASSYTLTKNDDGTSTLKITNAKEFWGASPYLIIAE